MRAATATGPTARTGPYGYGLAVLYRRHLRDHADFTASPTRPATYRGRGLRLSAVFHLALAAAAQAVMGPAAGTPWWSVSAVPTGGTPAADSSHRRADHPVVHVSWNDAIAYCEWAGRACPPRPNGSTPHEAGSTARATRGVMSWTGRTGEHLAGPVPRHNTMADGYLTTAPVRTYAPNDYGLWQTVGNVWEWCWDWYVSTYATSPSVIPRGPRAGPAR